MNYDLNTLPNTASFHYNGIVVPVDVTKQTASASSTYLLLPSLPLSLSATKQCTKQNVQSCSSTACVHGTPHLKTVCYFLLFFHCTAALCVYVVDVFVYSLYKMILENSENVW